MTELSNMRVTLALAALLGLVAALPTELPEPGQLALVLNEDDFEDYLDGWLAYQQRESKNVSSSDARSGMLSLCFYIFY